MISDTYRPHLLPVVALLTAVLLQACHSGMVLEKKRLETTGGAVSPYLTTDEQGNPVLCWTGMDPRDSVFTLKFARYESDRKSFGPAITVSGSEGAQTAAEAMNKIAFKSDGSIVAVFGKKFPQEKNPYAGAIYYSISADKGRSWSEPAFLHSDTAHHYGRGFFDVARIRNGEVAAVWLDGRLGKSEKGSALYFSSTRAGKGFGTDRMVDKNTCECCRTELLADRHGNLHVAYRKILYPAEKLGKPVRDMVYAVSADNGKSFSTPSLISQDGWVLDGCPHTGPSMAIAGQAPAAIWFTAGGTPGLYFSGISGDGHDSRTMVSRTGKHPQAVSWGEGRLAVIWEEEGQEKLAENGAGHHVAHDPSGTGIRVSLVRSGKVEQTLYRIAGPVPRHHPVILETTDGLLAAWIIETAGTPGIEYVHIPAEGDQ